MISFCITVFPINRVVVIPANRFICKVILTRTGIFVQKRSGEGNEEFWCYKFRSMKVNAEADTKQATVGDARITRVGSFLRKSDLDELPQFINVLLGDMSVVGPRPHMLKHTEEYSKS